MVVGAVGRSKKEIQAHHASGAVPRAGTESLETRLVPNSSTSTLLSVNSFICTTSSTPNMSEKRKREDGAPVPDYRPGNKKKQKTGFRVGPANLPDGTYKRKSMYLWYPLYLSCTDPMQRKRSKTA